MAGEYLEYRETREEISPVFDNCPETCRNEEKPDFGLCESCPVKIADQKFETAVNIRLENSKITKFNFNFLFGVLAHTLEMESLPENERTAQSQKLIDVLENERRKRTRFKNWKPPK